MLRLLIPGIFIFSLFSSCHTQPENTAQAAQHADSSLADKPADFSEKFPFFTLDWNNDGKTDTIFLSDYTENNDGPQFTGLEVKLCGQKPVYFGTQKEDDPWCVSFDDHADSSILRHNKLKTSLIVLLPIDNRSQDDLLLLNGYAFASDNGSKYIIRLDDKGVPQMVFDKEQSAFSFGDVNKDGTLDALFPAKEYVNLDGFDFDTTVNGPVPDSYSRITNKKGNIIEAYNPYLVYRFDKGTKLYQDTVLSRQYNISKGFPWSGSQNIEQFVLFYENKDSSPVLYERNKLQKKWNLKE
jgi:hypothetical protein